MVSHGPHEHELPKLDETGVGVDLYRCLGRDVLTRESTPVDEPVDSPGAYLRMMGFQPSPEVEEWLQRNREDLSREGERVATPMVLLGVAMARHAVKEISDVMHHAVVCGGAMGTIHTVLGRVDALAATVRADTDLTHVPPEMRTHIEEWLA
jgi:hypothetical protein